MPRRLALPLAALFALLFTLLFALPPLRAGDERAPLDEAPPAVRNALLDGDDAGALAQLEALEKSEPARGDLWALLRGQILLVRRDAAAAEQAFAAAEQRAPAGPWLAKARFGRATALRDLRRFADAEAIVAAEATRLRSDARRSELIGLAVELADRALEPGPSGAPDTPPADAARALGLYDQVVALDPPAALAARVQQQRGRALLLLKQPEPASAAFRAYLASEAARTLAPAVVDARLALARCEQELGRPGDARRTLDALARELAASGDAALRARHGDALLATARTWRRDDGRERLLAIAALRRFLEQATDHAQAWEVRLDVAQLLADAGRTEEARVALEELMARPAGGEAGTRAQVEAAFRRGQLLLAQEQCEAAGSAFADVIARDPTGPRWADAQSAMVEAEFRVGVIAASRKEFAAARAAFEQFIARHPLDGRIAAIRVGQGDLFARESDLKRAAGADAATTAPLDLAAIEEWRRVARVHPGSEAASESLYKVGARFEEPLHDLEQAVAAWRSCNFGSFAGHAAQQLARLLSKTLAVLSPRSFRGAETATLELRTRNVPKVKVKLHRLDLEAYFRKFLAADGVARLDLDLIAPEQELAFEVPGYARWKESVVPLPLPLTGSGAWVAVVESTDQRATTLVLKSDVDVIVKSAARELLVYAEERARGAAAEGVELLIDVGPGKDGARRQRSATTGPDGIAHLRLDEPFEPTAVRAFARRGDDVAVVNVNLQNVAGVPVETPRGLLFTDRPAYRPGQKVETCVFLREPVDGRLAVPPTKQWQLTVSDPRGRVVRRETLALDAFGSAASAFELDPLAPLGTWTLACERTEGPAFRATFLVADYQLDRVKLDLELPRRVWFRGETIELTALALWQHGAPVADARLRLQLPDGRLQELTTDALGRATVRFETVDLPEERALSFEATLLDGGVTAYASAFLALRAFDLALEVPARAVLSDERFAVVARATGRDGEPAAADVKVSLLRRTDGGGERPEQEQRVATAAADGRATFDTALPKGGTYVVRAEAIDRFGNPVVAEALLIVAGVDDASKLRLLADRTRLEVGESTRVRLVSRGGGGMVLLTWELADGLRWQVVDVREEVRELTVAADDGLAPGFVLAAAAIRGTRLDTADVAIAVTRALRLTVTPRSPRGEPGSDFTVDVTATDPLGKPLAARVALAVVDDALLRQFRDATPPVEPLFGPLGRTPTPAPWRVASSCSFADAAEATAISSEVLAEARRADAQKALDESARDMLSTLGYAAEEREANAPAMKRAELDDQDGVEVFQTMDGFASRRAGQGGGGGRGGMARKGGNARAPGFDAAVVESDTAFFAPAITTGADGKASVTFRLPERATTWQLIGRAITVDTRAAQANATVVAKPRLFAELRLPARLLQGDAPRLVATLFHEPEITGTAQLRLRATIGAQTVSLPATLDLARGETQEHLFDALPPLPLVDSIALELVTTVATAQGPLEQRFAATVAVAPWGVERVVARSGELRSATSFTLALPAEERFVAHRLDLLLSPSAPRLLLDDALDRGPQWRLAPRIEPQADAASELLGACEVLVLAKQLVEAQAATALDVSSLVDRTKGMVSRLVVTQREDGGWSWAGEAASDRATTALALVALRRARAIGFEVPEATEFAGLTFAEQAFRAAGPQAEELKALLQFALALHGRSDSSALQRLHRVRASLSTAGLSYACLALVAAEKAPMAADLATLLEQRAAALPAAPEGCRWDATANGRFHRSQLETSALAILALSAAAPGSPSIARGVEGLLAAHPWAPARAAGWVRAALGRFFATVAPDRAEARVRVRVDDQALEPVALKPGSGVIAVAVPAELLADGRVKIELELEGRARPSYVAALRGFTTDVKRRDRDDLRIVGSVTLTRPPPIVRGKPLPVGFSCLSERPADAWLHRVTELPVGELCDVALVALLPREPADADDPDPYLLTLPLPAGAELLPGSLQGDFAAWSEHDGVLDFRLLRKSARADVRFTLLGRVAGEWRALPPEVRADGDLDRNALGDPWTLRVLPRGAKSADVHRPTPDELLDLGERLFEAGDKKGAAAALDELVAKFGPKLKDAAQRHVARLLLSAALESGDAARIVREFEVVKEKEPALALPGETVRQVAAAYRAIEEPEPALELTRALIDETFSRDLQLAALLQGAQKWREAFALRERLWLDYPDTPAVKQSYLALSDEMLRLAPRATDDAALRAQGFDRATLQREGMRVLVRFLAHSSADPLAPEAGLGLVAAWLGLDQWEAASTLADRLAKRFKEPRFADSFLYSKAVAEWSLGRDDSATALLERIAAAEYVEPSGKRSPSVNRDLAWYILAQIAHAKRDAVAAEAWYEKVAAAFPDAHEALEGLRERRLSLPEVTTARPGQKASLVLSSRNLAQADLLVYPVDLMTLCLRERNLSGVAGVELAGIAPTVRTSVALPKEARFEARTTTVALDLPQAGAYLVLARSEEHHASGLVLVTPLELQVKEDDGGRVRVHVQESEGGKFVRDVDVRVIGSDNGTFVGGRTDARGLFVADAIAGRATIIARSGERAYAFWRGTQALGRDEHAKKKPAQQPGDSERDADKYLRNVLELNEGLQKQRQQQMEQELQNAGKDVKVQQRDGK